MNSFQESGYELELTVDFGKEDVSLDGSLKLHAQDNDKVTLTTVHFAAIVTSISFTREDVLVKLYDQVGSAAKVFGPYSDEVEELQSDVDDVKAGGALTQYAWLFE